MSNKLSEAILTAEARARLAENQGRIIDAKKLWLEADDLRSFCYLNSATVGNPMNDNEFILACLKDAKDCILIFEEAFAKSPGSAEKKWLEICKGRLDLVMKKHEEKVQLLHILDEKAK